MRVGAHVPMVGGVEHALEYALETGCETFQIFSKNPRQWAAKPLDPEACARFRDGVAARDVGPVFCHASYLINPGAEDEALWERSIAGLADELQRAAQVGAAGVVLHLGRRFSDDDGECLARVCDCIERAATFAGGELPAVLLENSAGAGRQFGVGAREMVDALCAVRARGVAAGLCIDTCHALAGGIDLRDAAGWRCLVDAVTAAAGPGAIALLHANDCKGDLGSNKDRHEWIGDGCLGDGAFVEMFSVPGLAGASAVVEMPGDPPEKDFVNVRRLKVLRDVAAGRAGRGPAPA